MSPSVSATPPTSYPLTLISQKVVSSESCVVLTPSTEMMMMNVSLKCHESKLMLLAAHSSPIDRHHTREKGGQQGDPEGLGAVLAAHTDYPVPPLHHLQQSIKAI